MTKKTKSELLEAVLWLLMITIGGLILFSSILFYPRLQYKYCFNQYIKSYQQETNFKEQNALEHCNKWINN